MIARETARYIAELVALAFTKHIRLSSGRGRTGSDSLAVYDFLYDREFPAWMCNAARSACDGYSIRPVQDFLMKLHTGESQYPATQNWTLAQREKLGQQYLQQLAEAILNHWNTWKPTYGEDKPDDDIQNCLRRLELDGFTFQNGRLQAPEEDAFDVKEEASVLQELYRQLGLGELETALHHLQLSEEHYLAGKWDDSISNSRKFLECVLRQVAACHSVEHKGHALTEEAMTRPAQVRDYLESEGLIEPKEKGALSSIYGLLSETGGHPYMAENEQARLLRHLALTLSQFIMLRFRGSKTGRA